MYSKNHFIFLNFTLVGMLVLSAFQATPIEQIDPVEILIRDYEDALDSVDSLNNRIRNLEQENNELIDENRQLRRLVELYRRRDLSRRDSVQILQREIDSLLTINNSLRDTLNLYEVTLHTIQSENQQLKEENRNLREQNQRLNNRIIHSMDRIASLRMDSTDNENEIQRLVQQQQQILKRLNRTIFWYTKRWRSRWRRFDLMDREIHNPNLFRHHKLYLEQSLHLKEASTVRSIELLLRITRAGNDIQEFPIHLYRTDDESLKGEEYAIYKTRNTSFDINTGKNGFIHLEYNSIYEFQIINTNTNEQVIFSGRLTTSR